MNEPADQSADGGRMASREVEIKFATNSAGLKQILKSPIFAPPAIVRRQILRSSYFDTSSGDLRKQKIALRIRKQGRGSPVLGVKAKRPVSEGPFSRTEIEVRSRSLEPDLALFDTETAGELGRLVGEKPLELQFETRVRRHTVLVARGSSQIELACDEGSIVVGDRTSELAEVELELKSGDESDLYDLAITLAEQFSLRLDFTSKAEHGFCLLTGKSSPIAKATAVEYGTDATLDDAVVAVISNTLAQFIGNWAALRATGRPSAVHQARVALRRLRVALKMFQRVLSYPQFDVLRAEAQRIASAFGPIREYDALIASVTMGPFAHVDRPTGFEALLATLEARRAATYRDVGALIDETRTSRFVLEIRSLLARRAWRNAPTGPQFIQLAGPAETFARSALDRLHARAIKRGKNLAELTDEERHEFRIALKNVRYAAEFFGTLFRDRRKIKAYVTTASRFQGLLGAHNDIVSMRRLLDDLPPGMERASGFILGWYAHRTSLAEAELGKAWKEFRKIDVFWR